MDVLEQNANDVLLIRPINRMDASSVNGFSNYVIARIKKGNKKIIFDLSELHYLSSAGLRLFTIFQAMISTRNGKMALCAANDNLTELFDIVHLGRVITICDTLNKALHFIFSGDDIKNIEIDEGQRINCDIYR